MKERGDTFGLQFDAAWTRLLQRGGWSAPSYSSFEEFWEKLQEKGGWWDPLYDFGERDRVFQTPSGKFEFVTRSVASPPPSVGSESSSLFPHWEEPKKGPDKTVYPFHLHIFKTIALTAEEMRTSLGSNPSLVPTFLGGGRHGSKSIRKRQEGSELLRENGSGWNPLQERLKARPGCIQGPCPMWLMFPSEKDIDLAVAGRTIWVKILIDSLRTILIP
jgi:hypothetical protein